MTIKELSENEFDPYYKEYISKFDDTVELTEGFRSSKKYVVEFFESIPNEKLFFRYKSDKWSIKEIFQHLIDTERIFIYRCFRIARNDKTALAGFDQNVYIEPSGADQKSINDLISEFYLTRKSSFSLLNSLNNQDLIRIGNANGGSMSARAAAFIILGHEIWHMEIIKERYL